MRSSNEGIAEGLAAKLESAGHDIIEAANLTLVEGVQRIAIDLSQVAGCQPDEDAGQPGERAFAVQTAIDLMDQRRVSREAKPSSARRACAPGRG
jgi:hypothetical protein